MKIFSSIYQILTALGIALAVALGLKKWGAMEAREDIKNKQNEDIINDIKENKNFKKRLSDISIDEKRDFLRSRFGKKK